MLSLMTTNDVTSTKHLIQSWIQNCGVAATWEVLGDALYEVRPGVFFLQEMFLK